MGCHAWVHGCPELPDPKILVSQLNFIIIIFLHSTAVAVSKSHLKYIFVTMANLKINLSKQFLFYHYFILETNSSLSLQTASKASEKTNAYSHKDLRQVPVIHRLIRPSFTEGLVAGVKQFRERLLWGNTLPLPQWLILHHK